MGMIEKVARAIRAADMAHAGVDDWPAWESANGEWKDVYRLRARAAIEAMREPTEEMIDAGIEAKMKLYERLEAEGKNTRIIVVANHPAGTIYEAMIDKALESGE